MQMSGGHLLAAVFPAATPYVLSKGQDGTESLVRYPNLLQAFIDISPRHYTRFRVPAATWQFRKLSSVPDFA